MGGDVFAKSNWNAPPCGPCGVQRRRLTRIEQKGPGGEGKKTLAKKMRRVAWGIGFCFLRLRIYRTRNAVSRKNLGRISKRNLIENARHNGS